MGVKTLTCPNMEFTSTLQCRGNCNSTLLYFKGYYKVFMNHNPVRRWKTLQFHGVFKVAIQFVAYLKQG